MDQILRNAEKAAVLGGDWQAVFDARLKSGDRDGALKVPTKGAVSVDCQVAYQYTVYYCDEDGWRRSVQGQNLEEVLKQFLALDISASAITLIYYRAVYSVLGFDFTTDSGPFPAHRLTTAEIGWFKEKARNHPDYMRDATAEQQAAANALDTVEANLMARRIQHEAEQQAARERKQQEEDNFKAICKKWHYEIWEIWQQYHHLPRKAFAIQVQPHPFKSMLFKLKDAKEQGVTPTQQTLREIAETGASLACLRAAWKATS